ncbi:uncharacterized protein LOC124643376 [Helicoverpa zea]|uniref:uncharacterized protein LOC124643376 n=1 Tax=Helicoverpa zea TaxID=7113 RepID=UPI001F57DE4D|nr:uncharacterized protein LOC124643376 [Helicoverpa zea]
MVSADNSFSPTNLFHYAEMLLKESKLREASTQHNTNNYSWLSSRTGQHEDWKTSKELDGFKPLIQKLSSENCAKIAVQLDSMTEEVELSSTAILRIFKKLLEEQTNIQLMDKNVIKAKERGIKKNRVNKVHPVLIPDGRQPTVSFILYT